VQISVESLSFAYTPTTRVLDDIDLSVDPGESVVLAGPNGSGKSTLLKLLSGVLQANCGTIRFDRSPIEALTARQLARRLAMVEQERSIGFDFTVREVVAMGRLPHRGRFSRESADDRRAIEQAMEFADVQGFAQRSIRAISGGERQRAYLATALAQQPKILLLDEPTTHLDLRHQVQFMSIVRQRVHDGMTVLTALHDLTLASQAADRIALMANGRIAAIGRPDDVLSPYHVGHVFGVDAAIGEHPKLGTVYVLPVLGPQSPSERRPNEPSPRSSSDA